jgi:hypothetical protein
MNIDIDSSSDDNDFFNPPPKRNKGPEQEACNIPRQPPRLAVTQTDRDAVVKKIDKVPTLLLIVDNKKGVCAQYCNWLLHSHVLVICKYFISYNIAYIKVTTTCRRMEFETYTIMLM